jgi:hypothetical protein
MKVVYAIRLSFEGGQEELEKLDSILRAAADEIFPDDPLMKITRGEFTPMDKNPYPSAGFLHDGAPRVNSLPRKVEDTDTRRL